MAYGSYNQYDSRWGKKNYNGSSTMAAAGCGPTACANILHNIDSSITPITTMKYMQTHGDANHKTFAIYGNGTAWNGIPACLKAFGAKEVKTQEVSKSMTNVWKVLQKGHVAVFLMSAGTRGGITWTTGGHYLAIIGYKYENNKHYVKVEDSGGRGHDGWYCYETQMRGLIPKVWTCLAKKKDIKVVEKPQGTYSGALPTKSIKYGDKNTDVKNWQEFLNWYCKVKLAKDGAFGEKTEEQTCVFQKTEGLTEDGVVGSKTLKRAKTYLPKEEVAPTDPITVSTTPNADKIVKSIYALAWPKDTAKSKWAYDTGAPTADMKKAMIARGYKTKIQFSDCGYCVNTVVYNALELKLKFLSSPSTPFSTSKEGFKIVHTGKIENFKLKPGDIIRYKKTNGGQHILFYLGGGLIAEGGRGTRFFVIRKSTKYNDSNVKFNTLQVLRAIEPKEEKPKEEKPKEEKPKETLPKKCIDVSYWQGKISVENWKKIKKTCGYAIIRTSYTNQSKFNLNTDSTFETNFKNAQAAGLKVGAYHYSQAITVDEAKKEAEYMCKILKNYKPDFYVVCDFEYGGRLNSNIGKKASDIANAFCDVVKSHGYEPCIYANTSTLTKALTNPKYPVWVAQYNSTCTYKGDKVMWQYTSKGKVDGIYASNTNTKTNNVDLSHVYV